MKHIGPTTPVEGLDAVDRARRMWARKWGEVYGGNGAVFPDAPGPDRKVIGAVFGHHRTNKLEQPLNDWCSALFDAFLAIKNDRLLMENHHALRFLPAAMPRLVVKVAEEWAANRPEPTP